MEKALLDEGRQSFDAVIYLASVLDFNPKAKLAGKISSSEKNLQVDFVSTKKLINVVEPKKRWRKSWF